MASFKHIVKIWLLIDSLQIEKLKFTNHLIFSSIILLIISFLPKLLISLNLMMNSGSSSLLKSEVKMMFKKKMLSKSFKIKSRNFEFFCSKTKLLLRECRKLCLCFFVTLISSTLVVALCFLDICWNSISSFKH